LQAQSNASFSAALNESAVLRMPSIVRLTCSETAPVFEAKELALKLLWPLLMKATRDMTDSV
jgi:hypothetical protein